MLWRAWSRSASKIVSSLIGRNGGRRMGLAVGGAKIRGQLEEGEELTRIEELLPLPLRSCLSKILLPPQVRPSPDLWSHPMSHPSGINENGGSGEDQVQVSSARTRPQTRRLSLISLSCRSLCAMAVDDLLSRPAAEPSLLLPLSVLFSHVAPCHRHRERRRLSHSHHSPPAGHRHVHRHADQVAGRAHGVPVRRDADRDPVARVRCFRRLQHHQPPAAADHQHRGPGGHLHPRLVPDWRTAGHPNRQPDHQSQQHRVPRSGHLSVPAAGHLW